MHKSITAVLLLLCSVTALANSPKIVAHRGGTADAPENTIYAIDQALKNGADKIWITVVMVNKFCRRSKRHFLVHDIFDVALNNQSLNSVDNNCKTEYNFQLHRQQIDDS
ncbi:hypothetical protein ArsFIN_09690 [Arsenophonus nasoniae]|nr:hypothetical protein ArsFIN_09690 [Arsenophonus nasoniae]